MKILTRITLLLGLTLVGAHPQSQSGSIIPRVPHLSKRALPQWQNFQQNDPKITQLTQAFKDMKTVVSVVVAAADGDKYKAIFPKYFPSQLGDAVAQVLNNMINPATKDPDTGADIISTINLDNNDHAGLDALGYVAYTGSGETATDPYSMHFADGTKSGTNAYKYPALSQVNCGTIGDVVSDKMLTLGGYSLVHELTHAGPIFQGDKLKEQTTLPDTQDYAYGPQKVRQLAAGLGKDSDNNPLPAKRSIVNADSFAWFVNEVYWAITCNKDFGDPTDNSYTPAGVCASGSTCNM